MACCECFSFVFRGVVFLFPAFFRLPAEAASAGGRVEYSAPLELSLDLLHLCIEGVDLGLEGSSIDCHAFGQVCLLCLQDTDDLPK